MMKKAVSGLKIHFVTYGGIHFYKHGFKESALLESTHSPSLLLTVPTEMAIYTHHFSRIFLLEEAMGGFWNHIL